MEMDLRVDVRVDRWYGIGGRGGEKLRVDIAVRKYCGVVE